MIEVMVRLLYNGKGRFEIENPIDIFRSGGIVSHQL